MAIKALDIDNSESPDFEDEISTSKSTKLSAAINISKVNS